MRTLTAKTCFHKIKFYQIRSNRFIKKTGKHFYKNTSTICSEEDAQDWRFSKLNPKHLNIGLKKDKGSQLPSRSWASYYEDGRNKKGNICLASTTWHPIQWQRHRFRQSPLLFLGDLTRDHAKLEGNECSGSWLIILNIWLLAHHPAIQVYSWHTVRHTDP